MPLEPLTPARRREQTRDHLLAAGAHVFAARGYHAASLDEVAEAAGFTKGAVYSNFASKEDLFLAIMARQEAALVDAFGQAAEAASEPAGTIAALRAVYAATDREARERDWCLWHEYLLYALRTPGSRHRVAESERRVVASVTALVEHQAAQAGIALPIPAQLVARIHMALFTGFWQQQATDPDRVDDDDFPAAVVFVGQALEALRLPPR